MIANLWHWAISWYFYPAATGFSTWQVLWGAIGLFMFLFAVLLLNDSDGASLLLIPIAIGLPFVLLAIPPTLALIVGYFAVSAAYTRFFDEAARIDREIASVERERELLAKRRQLHKIQDAYLHDLENL